ncbi:MAG: MDR family MFS transporter [Acetobacteraceae bacterium]
MPNELPARGSDTRRRLVLAACLIATFMAAVESSIVATTLPTIVADLGGFNVFSWVFTIYLLTQAVSIPIYGRLADLYGRKPVIFVGTGMFLCGSILCGLAWNMPSLICFRALEGIGAGAIQPIAATILGDIYSPTERGKVQGLVSSVFGVSAVIGPSMGAFLIQYVSWRVVFWVNVPIGVVAIIMLAVFLKENVERRPHRVDWLGSFLLLLACGALMMALVQAGRLEHLTLVLLIALGIAALLALFLHERTTAEPMLPLELWRTNRIVVVGSLGSCFAGAVMMGVSAFLPAYVQGAMGRTAISGGLVLGAMSVSWAAASILGARLMAHTTYRLVAACGGLCLLTGSTMLVLLRPEHGPFVASIGSFVIGIGMGFCNTVYIVSIQASVPWRQRGAATSSSMFLRFVGQAGGAAGCGAVLNATMLRLDPTAAHAVDRMLDLGARAAMDASEVARLTDIIARSLQNAYLLAAAFAVVTLALAFGLPARLNPRQQIKPD